MTAYLTVRAEVAEADREAFDHWYETEHLPDARAAFGALSAWRGWSDMTPGVHVATYEFATLEDARKIMQGSPQLTAMVSEFDRVWQDRVKRTRDLAGVTQKL